MKRLAAIIITFIMVLTVTVAPALAVDNSRAATFTLSANGSADSVAVTVGQIITVQLEIQQTADSNGEYFIHAAQDEIRFNPTYYKLVENSITISAEAEGFDFKIIKLSDSDHRVKFDFYTKTKGGTLFPAKFIIGTFQLEALMSSGESDDAKIANERAYTTTPDFKDEYGTIVKDIKIKIETVGGNGDGDGSGTGGGGSSGSSGTGGGGSSGSIDGGSIVVGGGSAPAPKPSEISILDPDVPLIGIRFTDVLQSHWAFEYIEYLAQKGFVTGKTAATFAPSAPITRAEFVTILARMSGDTLPAYNGPFTDVKASAYYAAAVSWAIKAGVTIGTSDTTFSPNKLIKRQEMAVMLLRYAEYKKFELKPVNEEKTFSDQAQIQKYALEAVKLMQRADIIGGYKDGAFRPLGNATRAEAAKMMGLLHYLMNA